MDFQLKDFLRMARVGEGANYTHSSQMSSNRGIYHLEGQKLQEFLKLYCDRLFEAGHDEFMAGIAEKPADPDNGFMPVLGDIDIKCQLNEELNTDQHFYTEEQLLRVVQIFFDVMLPIVINDSTHQPIHPNHRVCFILEKEKPYVSGDYAKSGFHLHFPFIYLSASDQEIQIVSRVKELVDEENLFSTNPGVDLASSADAVDNDISKKHWLMYGSRKDTHLTAYKVTKIVNDQGQELSLEQVMQNNTLKNAFGENLITDDNPLEYYLPIILSVHPYNRTTYKVRREIEVKAKQRLTHAEKLGDYFYEQLSMPETIRLCRKLVAMLSPARTEHHDPWIRVGWVLFSVTQGSREGFDMWVQFSLLSTTRTHVDEARCLWEWNKMQPGKCKYTLGTLRMWAKEDNPQAYDKMIQETQLTRIQDSLGGGHVDIAKFMFEKFGDQFVCVDLERHTWLYFDNHRWKYTQKGHHLRQKIDTYVLPHFYAESNKGLAAVQADSTNNSHNHNADTIKRVLKIVYNLKSQQFRDSLMKACAHEFHKPDFLEKLDEHCHLVGFNNGVLDLQQMVFRPGQPDDYITFTTGYDYVDYKSWDHPDIQRVQDFFMKIYVDADVRQSFYDWCGKLLYGGNEDQQCLFLHGKGANGKTAVDQLIFQTLGGVHNLSYAYSFPTSSLTGKDSDSNACTPELVASKGKRYCSITEPNKDDDFNIGRWKKWTGLEPVNGRALYKDSVNFIPQFKLAYICNHLPNLPEDDDAAWRRVLLYRHKSWFPPNDWEVPPTWAEQVEKRIFVRDKNLNSKIPQMRQPFMWIMYQCYRRIKLRPIQPPLPIEVVNAIDQYRQDKDILLKFIRSCLKKDENASISLNDFYTNFCNWYREETGFKPMTKQDLKAKMEDKWDPLDGTSNRWSGWRLKTLEDEIAEGTAAVVRAS